MDRKGERMKGWNTDTKRRKMGISQSGEKKVYRFKICQMHKLKFEPSLNATSKFFVVVVFIYFLFENYL